MSYRVTGHLWDTLQADERSIRWLARKAGCSHNFLLQLKSGRRPTLSDDLATRIAGVLGTPVADLFTPVTTCDRETAAVA